MSWSRWNWLDDAVLPLAVAILRACWLWPWLELTRRWFSPSRQETLLPVSLMIALFLGGMAAGRWASIDPKGLRDPSGLWRARLAVAGGGLVIIVLVLWGRFYRMSYHLWNVRWLGALGLSLTHWGDEIPAPFITLIASAYLWLRGVLDGRRPLLYDDVWGAFAAGFVMLALLVLGAAATQSGIPTGTEHAVLLFFGTGMAALALSGLEVARGSGRRQTEAQLKLNRYWLVSVASVIVGLLGLGLGLSALIAPETVARALSWTSIILKILGWLLYYLFFAFSYLIFLILDPLIRWLRSLLSSPSPREPMQMPDFQRQFEEMTQGQPATIPPALEEAFRWLGLAIVVLVIGLAFALALRRFWVGKEDEVEETRELILSRDLLQEQLSRLWRNWLQRLRRAPSVVFSPFLSLEGEPDTRRAIRAIYQALLAAAGERGLPRARGQTPIEYRNRLGELFPNAPGALDTVTDEYVQARYNPDVPTVEQAERARQAWEELQATLTARDDHEA